MVRRIVAVSGSGLVIAGMWAIHRTSQLVNGCQLSSPALGTSQSVNGACVQTLARYGEGGVLVLAGLVLMVIAWRLISRQHRLDRASLFAHVPRRLIGPTTYHLSSQLPLGSTPDGRVHHPSVHHR